MNRKTHGTLNHIKAKGRRHGKFAVANLPGYQSILLEMNYSIFPNSCPVLSRAAPSSLHASLASLQRQNGQIVVLSALSSTHHHSLQPLPHYAERSPRRPHKNTSLLPLHVLSRSLPEHIFLYEMTAQVKEGTKPHFCATYCFPPDPPFTSQRLVGELQANV